MEKEKTEEPKIPVAVSIGAGAVAGGTTTASTAIAAAGTGGVAGYFTGIGALAANIGCETAAVIGLGTVAAGPIVGGLLGYGIYRSVKKIAKR